MISIVRFLGAPVIEPPGKQARMQSGGSTSSRELAADGGDELVHRRVASRRRNSCGTCTVPTSQTTPRSLRSRSTIIRFSARSFSSSRSSSASRSVLGGVAPRGRVPLIGLASTQRSRPIEQEALGRGAEHRDVAEAQEGREGRRVDAAQRAVERQRLGRDVGGDLVGQADLVGLARR